MNKPRVDWIRIIWKCQSHFEYNSNADCFATEQCLMFGINELKETNARRETGQKGHKSPRKNLYKARYDWPSDLNCDDPYYDGVPVL